MKKLKGRLSIGFVSSNAGDGYVRVEIEDEASRVTIVVAEVSHRDLAPALSGRIVPCEMRFTDVPQVVGCTAQHKTELVTIPGSPYGGFDIRDAEKAASLHEVDGWAARPISGRRLEPVVKTEIDFITPIHYYRYVDPEGNPVAIEKEDA